MNEIFIYFSFESFLVLGDDINDLCIVASYKKGLNIFCFNGFMNDVLVLHEIKSHSVHKNFICYEKYGGRMTISKLIKNNGTRELEELWFSRIYSPDGLTCMNMWYEVCTFLIKDDIKTINYLNKDLSPMEIMAKKTRIIFSLSCTEFVTKILRNNVIVRLCKFDFKGFLIDF